MADTQSTSIDEVVEEIMSCQLDLEPEERIDKDWFRTKLTTLVEQARGEELARVCQLLEDNLQFKAIDVLARTISSDKK